MRMRLIVLAGVLAFTLSPSVRAAPYTAPGNKVLWGGQGGYTAGHIADFERQSGKHPAVFNYFISWSASESSFHWLGFRLQDAEREGSRAMLSVSPEDTRLPPADIAGGRRGRRHRRRPR